MEETKILERNGLRGLVEGGTAPRGLVEGGTATLGLVEGGQHPAYFFLKTAHARNMLKSIFAIYNLQNFFWAYIVNTQVHINIRKFYNERTGQFNGKILKLARC